MHIKTVRPIIPSFIFHIPFESTSGSASKNCINNCSGVITHPKYKKFCVRKYILWLQIYFYIVNLWHFYPDFLSSHLALRRSAPS